MCFSASTFSIAPQRPPGKAVTSNLILHSCMLFTKLLFIFFDSADKLRSTTAVSSFHCDFLFPSDPRDRCCCLIISLLEPI